jgi:hypothetical protein
MKPLSLHELKKKKKAYGTSLSIIQKLSHLIQNLQNIPLLLLIWLLGQSSPVLTANPKYFLHNWRPPQVWEQESHICLMVLILILTKSLFILQIYIQICNKNDAKVNNTEHPLIFYMDCNEENTGKSIEVSTIEYRNRLPNAKSARVTTKNAP